eukprot:TRINITY_DN781792_c0_g1_i1.p1 TRINITY_DN781792_c0_g1~~TRINITY_DN781792_c0_g1_i1.p1  ORF type:complete len:245 (-),score=56.13 TRINITY_DN781792_c0_g1_i1:244-951(-)
MSSRSWVESHREVAGSIDGLKSKVHRLNQMRDAGKSTSHYIHAIRKDVEGIKLKIGQLRTALVQAQQNPKSKLSKQEIHKRQKLVERLEREKNAVVEKMNQGRYTKNPTSNREALFAERSGQMREDRMGTKDQSDQSLLDRQHMRIQEQDDVLDQLGNGVSMLTEHASAMKTEAELHNDIIDDINEEVGLASGALKQHTDKAKAVQRREKMGCEYCIMLLLLVAIVAVIAIKWGR